MNSTLSLYKNIMYKLRDNVENKEEYGVKKMKTMKRS